MELYIHIPFCQKKCRYCSFVSYVRQESFYETYINLIIKEALNRISEVTEPIRTVYIGGGTPSLVPPALFSYLIENLRTIYSFSEVTEFSVEANPGTVHSEWLAAAVHQGINRLSLGMQAYQEHLLQVLGRIHRHDDVIHAVRMARKAGIKNISLDLIFGIPLQKRGDWIDTIMAALDLHPEHISAYGLIPEEGTPLYEELQKGILSLPDSDEERKMYDDLLGILAQNHYQQYEISNFSIKTHECRHNIGYWTQIPYIGLGISAASMTGLDTSDTGISYIRRNNPDSITDYTRMVQEKRALYSVESVNSEESRFESLMLGLRMNCGVDELSFQKMHGKTLDACFGSKLRLLEQKGLLIHDNHYWKMTRRGFDIQNSILVELMD